MRDDARRLASVLLFSLLAVLFIPAAHAQNAPSLVTDKPAYEAGETITFKGSGWTPNEQVSIDVRAEDGGDDDVTNVTARADGNGDFTASATMPAKTSEELRTTSSSANAPRLHISASAANENA